MFSPTQQPQKGDNSPSDLRMAMVVSGCREPGLEPWFDRSLPDAERLKCYAAYLKERLRTVQEGVHVAGSQEAKIFIQGSESTKELFKEVQWILTVSARGFCDEMNRRLLECLPIPERLVASYSYNSQTGVSTFTIPAGVTDIEAMKAVNQYFGKHFPGPVNEVIWANHFHFFQRKLGSRDSSQAREVTITAVVKGTDNKDRAKQAEILKKKGLIFSDERDVALAAALHHCANYGEDLFGGICVRGSIRDVAVFKYPHRGVGDAWGIEGNDRTNQMVAASGSPFPHAAQM